jgi:hypothetical protein
MAESLLTVRPTISAQVALSSLGAEERRLVEGWFEHLRHWHTDEFVRSRSRRLTPDEELYAFETSSSDLMLAFRVAGDAVVVESIFNRDWLRAWKAGLEHSPA